MITASDFLKWLYVFNVQFGGGSSSSSTGSQSMAYAATTAILTGYVYDNGVNGVGATLTAPGNGVVSIDGVTPAAGAAVLVKDQGIIQSGLYNITVNSAGAPAVFTRCTNYDTGAKMNTVGLIPVQFGTVNAGRSYYLANIVGTIGSTSIAYLAYQLLAYPGTGRKILMSASSIGAPIWSTSQYPDAISANTILYASSANTIAGLANLANSVLVYSSGGVPSASATLPAGLTIPTPIINTANFTGATNTYKEFTATVIAPITLDPANGFEQTLTLTANTTITMAANPALGTVRPILLNLIQGGSGGYTVSWVGITFATNTGTPPTISAGVGAETSISIMGQNSGWVGYPVNQGVGLTGGAPPLVGFVGYSTTINIAIGAAVNLASGVVNNITSFTLQPGNYNVTSTAVFVPASGTIATLVHACISPTSLTLATSPNGGSVGRLPCTFAASEQICMPCGLVKLYPTVTTTYYFVATSNFSVSTMSVCGSLNIEEFS